ncbi:MAG: sugar ABC transporter ATP-binding protein [Candidatus Humimicrobiaceae bacterium]
MVLENIIEFKNITKKFPGVIALDCVNLSIIKGEIHALVGENGAGKSTLMNILAGVLHPDIGEVIYKGKHTILNNPMFSRQIGISTVYQELKLCENLSVVENIYLGREKKSKFGRIYWKTMSIAAKELLDSFGVSINPKSIVKNITVAQRQIVEIARAISLKTDVLILDEPTSSLTINETRLLFENLKKLQATGVTIIFISHRLEEVFKISDRISVLRDGKYLGTFEKDKISEEDIVSLIAGKKLYEELIKREMDYKLKDNIAVLEVNNLSRGEFFKGISFKLFEKETLGFYGLQGSGRTEVIETIFGLYKPDLGDIYLFGEKMKFKRANDAIKKGLAFVPEDRRRYGLFENMSVKENMALIILKVHSVLSFIINSKVIKTANTFTKKLEIKMSSLNQKVKNLSGGNQQKVIIARGLASNPKILLMDEPTRGIDVGSKAEIYKILRDLKKNENKSIIIISSELPEVLAECDRVIVMRNGRITGEVTDKDINEEKILKLAFSG